MAAIARKTVVATGATSGLGFEAIKQLLLAQKETSYSFILGCRNIAKTQSAFEALKYDANTHSLTYLPLDLADLRTVKAFASESLNKVDGSLDYLFLNAAHIEPAKENPSGSQWCTSLVVNAFSQHYLIDLLREKIAQSKTRVVVVSSGVIRMVKETETLESALKAGSGTDPSTVYATSKFVQLLNALYWKRTFAKSAEVVAVSPGMIPGTGLGRHLDQQMPADHPDAKPVETGGASLLAAFHIKDVPEDPTRIFLTSWGEWWEPDVYKLALNESLQDKWSPSRDKIETDTI